jgi:hypothetical protein
VAPVAARHRGHRGTARADLHLGGDLFATRLDRSSELPFGHAGTYSFRYHFDPWDRLRGGLARRNRSEPGTRTLGVTPAAISQYEQGRTRLAKLLIPPRGFRPASSRRGDASSTSPRGQAYCDVSDPPARRSARSCSLASASSPRSSPRWSATSTSLVLRSRSSAGRVTMSLAVAENAAAQVRRLWPRRPSHSVVSQVGLFGTGYATARTAGSRLDA